LRRKKKKKNKNKMDEKEKLLNLFKNLNLFIGDMLLLRL
jgi:hypothetical protein